MMAVMSERDEHSDFWALFRDLTGAIALLIFLSVLFFWSWLASETVILWRLGS